MDGGGAGPVEDDGVIVANAADLDSGVAVPERGVPLVFEGIPWCIWVRRKEADETFEEHVAIIGKGKTGEGLETGITLARVRPLPEKPHEGIG